MCSKIFVIISSLLMINSNLGIRLYSSSATKRFQLFMTLPTTSEVNSLKTGFHIRNKHRDLYDFNLLRNVNPDFSKYLSVNKYGNESIDFSNADAVIALNKSLLKAYYNIKEWYLPEKYLCPPIPSRVDYIHHISDLISSTYDKNYICSISKDRVLTGPQINCLDIGTGANVIYPLLGATEYGWKFVGTDIDKDAINSAKAIVEANSDAVGDRIRFRLQNEKQDIFLGIIRPDDRFDCTICNPPFHSDIEEANDSATRKWIGLNKKKLLKGGKPRLNFGGQGAELVYENGGEIGFLRKMIRQSSHPMVKNKVLWFTSLISKASNLDTTYRLLEETPNLVEHRTVEMIHGQKKSRIIAWTFLNENERDAWYSK